MPIHPVPPANILHFNPSTPVVPIPDLAPTVWIPCYTAIAWDESNSSGLITHERLATDLEKSLENINKETVYFPDWHDRFSFGSHEMQTGTNPVLEQLKVFAIRSEFHGLCIAVQQHFANLSTWLFSRITQLDDLTTPSALRMLGVSEAFDSFSNRFSQRYLSYPPDHLFFERLNTTFHEVYQRTCLDILTLGHTALALAFGYQRGDAACVAWCNEMGNRLLSTLQDLSAPAGAWNVCEPGMVTHMSDAVLAFRRAIFPPDLASRFLEMREKCFEQTVMETGFPMLSREVINLPGNEVHVINAWRSAMQSHFALRERENDIFVTREMLGSDSTGTRIVNALQSAMSPAATLYMLAEQGLSQFSSCFVCPTQVLDPDVMQSAHQSLCREWGEIPLNVLVRTDTQSGCVFIHDKPVLLAAFLLDKLLASDEIPAALKQGLASLQLHSLELGLGTTLTPEAYRRAGKPRLISFFNTHDNSAMAWVQRTFSSASHNVHTEYALPELDDFSMAQLASVCALEDAIWPHESKWAQQDVLIRGLVIAYMNADADEVERFSALPGSEAMGFNRLRKWPVHDNQWDARMAVILQLSVCSPVLRCMARMYREEWMQQSARAGLLISILRNQNGGLLAALVSNGHVSPDLPLLGQYACLPVTDALVAVSNHWFENALPGECPAVSQSIEKLVDDMNWRLSDDVRLQLKQAIRDFRQLYQQRLHMEPVVDSESD